MTTLNQVQIVGRLGQDPEIRYFESGTALCKLSVAVNRINDKNPDWFNVELWGKQAEVAANYTAKGSLIGIEGELKLEEWEDKATGEEKSKPIIRASRLELLSKTHQTSTPEVPKNLDYDW